MKFGLRSSLALLSLLFFSNIAYGACTASVTNLAFGPINPLGGGATSATATASFNCTANLPLSTIQVCANLGIGSGGAAASGLPRYMLSGSNQLSYQIYQDSGLTQVWGSTAAPYNNNPAPPSLLITMNALGAGSGSLTLYGSVLGGQQTIPTGSYSSTFSTATYVNFLYRTYIISTPCSSGTGVTLSPSFTVTAAVNSSCTLTTSPVTFGTITSLTAPVNASGNLAVTCTASTSYQVGLDNGQNGTGPTARKMAFGTNRLTYGLYSDSGYSVAWGNTAGSLVSGVGTGTVNNLSVYGRVFTQSLPAPGTYTDTVVATVTY